MNSAKIEVGAQTDIGLVRKQNQDSYSVHNADEFGGKISGLYIVADGMGGAAGGEVASRITVDTIPEIVSESIYDRSEPLSEKQLAALIKDAIETANEAVWEEANSNAELRGMGTTVVVAAILGANALIANVGDSRVYLCRGGILNQVTNDHSLVAEQVRAGKLTPEEAQNSRYSNVITRAVGIGPEVEPDLQRLELLDGDTLLLCSDGLTNMVSGSMIAEIITANADLNVAASQLIDAAKAGGGKDNITAALIRFGEYRSSSNGIDANIDSPVHIDNIETPFDSVAAIPKTKTRTVIRWSLVFAVLWLATLFGLVRISQLVYDFSFSSPYMKKKPPQTVIQTVTPPAIDYTTVAYSDPIDISKTHIKPTLLLVDGNDRIICIAKETGKTVAITKDGKETPFGPPDLSSTKSGVYTWSVDPQGNLYVISKESKAILKFDLNGTRIGIIGEPHLKEPQSVAVGKSGDIFVIDGEILKKVPATFGKGNSNSRPIAGATPLSVDTSNASR